MCVFQRQAVKYVFRGDLINQSVAATKFGCIFVEG
jgi:hypothetical protein